MTDPATLFWLSSFSLLYLLSVSLILIRNRFEFKNIGQIDHKPDVLPAISVCVPARNEEDVIECLLLSVCEQVYPNFELLVLDDHSTDKTSSIIESVRSNYPDLVKPVQAQPKPDNWLGKPWACQQLADHAKGDIYLFLDADTKLFPGMLAQIAGAFDCYKLDMITVWPEQVTKTFWEKMIVPMIYYALLSLLPTAYVHRSPRWVPSFFRSKINPLFAAACGQCLGFTASAYTIIGGHQIVKNNVVEDVELARTAKQKKLKLRMFGGVKSISCRMYRSEKEIFNGLRKNFFAGFGKSLPLFLGMAVIHIIVYVLPFILLPCAVILSYSSLFFLSIASVSLILLHRFIIAIWFHWNPVYGLLHPLAVLWFQRLGIVTLTDHLLERKVTWKDREL